MAEERVVYLLGAGFSAPLGLPVVRNFISRAKDLYFQDKNGREHFDDVFKEMDRLAKIKNYFDADLLDIEEIFSILDMRAQFHGRQLSHDFRRFICDVVKSMTPRAPDRFREGGTRLFRLQTWGGYIGFTLALLRQGLVPQPPTGVKRMSVTVPTPRYDVISLNYDLVLETCARVLEEEHPAVTMWPCHFQRDFSGNHQEDPKVPRLIKLHGCVSDGKITPPTWRKGGSRSLTKQWSAARDVLSRANYLRILGYSLPTSDAYVRYLLKASVSNAPHLKAIDVLTLNPDDEARYRSFITFKEMRYAEVDLASFFQTMASAKTYAVKIGSEHPSLEWFDLESVHERQFRR